MLINVVNNKTILPHYFSPVTCQSCQIIIYSTNKFNFYTPVCSYIVLYDICILKNTPSSTYGKWCILKLHI